MYLLLLPGTLAYARTSTIFSLELQNVTLYYSVSSREDLSLIKPTEYSEHRAWMSTGPVRRHPILESFCHLILRPSTTVVYVSSSYRTIFIWVFVDARLQIFFSQFPSLYLFLTQSHDIECIWLFWGIFHVHFRLCLFFGIFYVIFLLYLLHLVVFGIFYPVLLSPPSSSILPYGGIFSIYQFLLSFIHTVS